MASQTLQRMQKALAKVVSRPKAEVLAELKEIAAGDRTHPAPHLAMAIVTGFLRHEFEESKGHLADAGKLLKEWTGGKDAEWEFSDCLFRVLQNEFKVLDARSLKKGAFDEDVLEASIASRKAILQMGSVGKQIKDSMIVNIIYAALRALSLTSNPGSSEFRGGMTMLSARLRAGKEVQDLAGLFLMYGYRKNRDYKQAIRVGLELEKRNPRSPILKMALGVPVV